MGEVQLDLLNTVYWMRLILPIQTGTGMTRETKKGKKGKNNGTNIGDSIMFQDWSLLVKLNQRNHRTGNKTCKGEILVRRGSKVLALKPFLFKGSTMC